MGRRLVTKPRQAKVMKRRTEILKSIDQVKLCKEDLNKRD